MPQVFYLDRFKSFGSFIYILKGIGLLTYTCTLYESRKAAVHFASNIMEINDVIRKLYGFKHVGDLSPNEAVRV